LPKHAAREEIASRFLQLERYLADAHEQILQMVCDSWEREEPLKRSSEDLNAKPQTRTMWSDDLQCFSEPSTPAGFDKEPLRALGKADKRVAPNTETAANKNACDIPGQVIGKQEDELQVLHLDEIGDIAVLGDSPQKDDDDQMLGPDDRKNSKVSVDSSLREQIKLIQEQKLSLKATEAKKSKFLSSTPFALVVSSIILVNTLYMGIQSHMQVRDEFDRMHGREVASKKEMWRAFDTGFCIIFFAEMAFRIILDKRNFFAGREMYWNLFDMMVVATSFLELMVEYLDVTPELGNAGILRTLRVLRIVRLMKMGKMFKPLRAIIHNLQCILLAVSGSVESFSAAVLMFAIVLYIFGLTFMQGVVGYMAKENVNFSSDAARSAFVVEMAALEKNYGSIQATVWTLMSAVTGGVDWNDASEPIEMTNWYYKWYFLFYVLFVFMCLLNVLTGIFVNVAMQATQMNREIAIDEAIQNRDSIVKEVIELFLEADTDGSGALSFDEFQEFLADEKIKAFFMALELDMASSSRIFHLLDESGDGSIDAHEFVEGCIDLRGYARKVDITLLQREFHQKLDSILLHVTNPEMHKKQAFA
jgi:hypothetical protein